MHLQTSTTVYMRQRCVANPCFTNCVEINTPCDLKPTDAHIQFFLSSQAYVFNSYFIG